MRTIRIGFSKPKGKWFPIFSWAIRVYERTPFSHVYIRWETKYGPSLCYQASGQAINFMGPYAFDRHLTVVEEFEFEIPDESWEPLMSFCMENVGKEYDLLGVLGIPFVGLLKLSRNPFSNDENRQYCAELVTRIFQHLGMGLNMDANRVKLRQVHEFVRQLAAQRGKT